MGLAQICYISCSKSLLATLFVGSFSKIVVWALLGLSYAMYTCVGFKYTRPVPAATVKGTMFPLSICERNFFFLTLPPCRTPPWALIPFVGEITPWEAFN